jgi:hypothetical protein
MASFVPTSLAQFALCKKVLMNLMNLFVFVIFVDIGLKKPACEMLIKLTSRLGKG